MLVNPYNNSMFLRKGVNMKTLLKWLMSDNPTPQQIKNRIILNRKWKNFKNTFGVRKRFEYLVSTARQCLK